MTLERQRREGAGGGLISGLSRDFVGITKFSEEICKRIAFVGDGRNKNAWK